MKTVMVVYPVYVDVSDTDTIDSVLDKADDLITISSCRPLVQTLDGHFLSTDEELRDYVTHDILPVTPH